MKLKVPKEVVQVGLRAPDIIQLMVRYFLRRTFGVNRDYRRDDGASRPMTQISLRITNACNLKCKMCAQWGEAGYNYDKPSEDLKELVSVERYYDLVDEVAHIRPHFYIWGGEPFLYPDLMPLVRYMRKKDLSISIVTNGVKLEKYADELVDLEIDAVFTSLDGPEEIHNQIRGVSNSFETLKKGMHKISEFKKARNKVKPFFGVVKTITKDNYTIMDQTFQEAEDMNIDLMLIYFSWFTNPEIGAKHTEIMRRELGIDPYTWRGYLNDWSNVDLNDLTRKVLEVQKHPWKFAHFFIPNLEEKEIPEYYTDNEALFGYKRCTTPWFECCILPNGDVSTCRDYADVVVGNIMNENLLDIWNGEKYRNFRALLKKEGGLLPVCARCCGLMGL